MNGVTETPDQRIARLQSNLDAGMRNHALLSSGMPKVLRNNDALRSVMLELIGEIGEVDDLYPITERLRHALLAPRRLPPFDPDPFDLADEPAPEGIEDRIQWLEARLRICGRAVYQVQLKGSNIVWNSDHLRQVIRELMKELAEVPDLQPIVEKLEIGLEKASD